MPAPPFNARLIELVHEHLARPMPELILGPAQARCGATEAQKIRVAHLAERGAHCFESEWLESYGAHQCYPTLRLISNLTPSEVGMDLYEDLILQYLTKDAHMFVSPQYSIEGPPGTEWSCPDFIALGFREKRVSIVEVSSASNPRSLLERVKNRDRQWIERLKNQLLRNGVVDQLWKNFRVELFIRRSAADRFRKELKDAQDVVIYIIEELGAPWEWTRSYAPGDRGSGTTLHAAPPHPPAQNAGPE